MGAGTQRVPVERVRRRPRHGLSARGVLIYPATYEPTPESIRRWANFAHGSPLYRHYAELIASTPALLDVIAQVEHTPQTNVLFAAVQYLIAKGEGPELAEFYANFTSVPRTPETVDPLFTDFVLQHQDSIIEIGRTRYTQTNECRRCGVLLPAIWESVHERFHLIDVGCSAGLNLAMDLYKYRWGDVVWGEESGVELEVEVRGRLPRPRPIEVLGRTGLDLNPVDPEDADERLWLECLIWPEHLGRRERLRSALDVVRRARIEFVPGNATLTLQAVLDDLPDDDPAVVMNSFALNQFSSDDRRAIEGIVEEARKIRPIHRVSMEVYSSSNEWAEVRVDDGTGWWVFGQGHPHAEWVEFYARP